MGKNLVLKLSRTDNIITPPHEHKKQNKHRGSGVKKLQGTRRGVCGASAGRYQCAGGEQAWVGRHRGETCATDCGRTTHEESHTGVSDFFLHLWSAVLCLPSNNNISYGAAVSNPFPSSTFESNSVYSSRSNRVSTLLGICVRKKKQYQLSHQGERLSSTRTKSRCDQIQFFR